MITLDYVDCAGVIPTRFRRKSTYCNDVHMMCRVRWFRHRGVTKLQIYGSLCALSASSPASLGRKPNAVILSSP